MKLLQIPIADGSGNDFMFYCQGCRENHVFTCRTERRPNVPNWQFDGNLDKPTFTPSLHYLSNGETRCHLFVRDGKIQYLDDCPHALKGQTVDIPDLDAPETSV